jgi:hypothetical protein
MKKDALPRRTFFRHACCGTLGLAGGLGLLPIFAPQSQCCSNHCAPAS